MYEEMRSVGAMVKNERQHQLLSLIPNIVFTLPRRKFQWFIHCSWFIYAMDQDQWPSVILLKLSANPHEVSSFATSNFVTSNCQCLKLTALGECRHDASEVRRVVHPPVSLHPQIHLGARPLKHLAPCLEYSSVLLDRKRSGLDSSLIASSLPGRGLDSPTSIIQISSTVLGKLTRILKFNLLDV